MTDEKDIKVKIEDQEADADDSNEDSPLNSKVGSKKSLQERQSNKPKSVPDQLQQWLDRIQSNPDHRRTAIIAASCLLVIVVLMLVLVFWFLVVRDPLIDPNYRYLRLIPRNNEPKNTIRFSVGDVASWRDLTDQISVFLMEYNSTRLFYRDKMTNLRMDCNDLTVTANFNRSCFFSADEVFSLCSKRENYGYSEGSPCVFLKFNNVKGWMPELIRDRNQIQQFPPRLV